ncbi:response regulator transcription factor [Paenibacillus sacheonensis]|uniref:Response regulator n=1 Tax=Paenibacillus sacheonensis TaxID=742054 RepID=A0A7X5BWM7_9BACL|nr:response regulator [Paenibacillus sacheonensis]MBM7564251.1 two-component system response regulator YesN [Paenibacillus sacheonensis]NBC67426.1 response regulator [Paenibacillus sacheonensis]
MFRLLVVDDEPVIADGLFETLKEMEGFDTEVHKAYSGFEALALLNAKKFDLIVTDICMQGMDGLELVEKIKGSWPECKIVFLTGHDQFEYAYKALQFHGVSYLLKNEDYEKIVDTVRMQLCDLEKSLRDEHLLRTAREQMDKALPLLRRELLTAVLERGEGEDLGERLGELEIGISASRPVMLIVGCRQDLASGDANVFSRASEEYAVSLLVERYLSPYVRMAETVIRHSRTYFVWFAQPAAEGEDEGQHTPVFVKGALELVRQACQQSLGFSLSFIVGGQPLPWSNLAEAFRYARSVLNSRVEQGTDVLVLTEAYFMNDKGRPPQFDGQPLLVQRLAQALEDLELLLEQGQSEPFLEAYERLRMTMAEGASGRRSSQSETKQRLSLFFVSFLNRYELTEQLVGDIDVDALLAGFPALTLAETFEVCREVAQSIFRVRSAENERRSIIAIHQVQQYIQEHLDADLSLTSLADSVYFNPKYFSRLFRQVTGEYLSDYIHERRLRKAKEMLEQPQIKIHAVAAAIGYQSPSYFTRFFKKAMQMSPQEYRDSRPNAAGTAK